MIDFRYHIVSIVAVFLALAIGIVLGSTELQGTTIDGLRALSNSLTNQLANARADRDSYQTLSGASDTFLSTAESKLVSGYLAGDRLVIVTEPGAPSSVISGIKQAAGLAGATVAGTVALQPKFNDLSGATLASLSAINAQQASADGTALASPAASQTGDQQQAAQLIASAILDTAAGAVGLPSSQALLLLQAYAQAGYLSVSGTVTDRSTLAVIVTPQTAPSAGSGDPANQVLLTVAAQFAATSSATLVSGSTAGSSPSGSAISVLRGSSVSGQVSSVDNADTTLGQISSVWALAGQAAGSKPGNYGISGASAVSPAVPAEPSAPASPSVTPTTKATGTTKAAAKVKPNGATQ